MAAGCLEVAERMSLNTDRARRMEMAQRWLDMAQQTAAAANSQRGGGVKRQSELMVGGDQREAGALFRQPWEMHQRRDDKSEPVQDHFKCTLTVRRWRTAIFAKDRQPGYGGRCVSNGGLLPGHDTKYGPPQ
jgi:hypothetical protein